MGSGVGNFVGDFYGAAFGLTDNVGLDKFGRYTADQVFDPIFELFGMGEDVGFFENALQGDSWDQLFTDALGGDANDSERSGFYKNYAAGHNKKTPDQLTAKYEREFIERYGAGQSKAPDEHADLVSGHNAVKRDIVNQAADLEQVVEVSKRRQYVDRARATARTQTDFFQNPWDTPGRGLL